MNTFVLARKLLRRRHVMKDRVRKRREAKEQKQIPSSSTTHNSNFAKFEAYFASRSHEAELTQLSKTSQVCEKTTRYPAYTSSEMCNIVVKKAKITPNVNISTKNENIFISPIRKNQL